MDHAPGRPRAEDRVPGGRLSPERALLRTSGTLAFGSGEDITLGGALAVALLAGGEERQRAYDDAAAGSSVAFQLRVDERWDPATASPHDPEAIERAAASVGLRADVVAPPFDEELAELVWERIVESVDASLPPLARGLLGLAEFGVVIGYDRGGRVLFARTYADRGDEPARLLAADALAGETAATFAFLDRADRPSEAALARDAVRRAVAASESATHTTVAGARLFHGDAAFGAWLEALGADVPPREAAQRAFVDHARRVFLHDARRTAARFLRRVRRHFPERAGAELVRAAESYGHVADECEKHGTRPFDATVVARFLDPGQRRGWQHALERAREHDRDAAGALAAAAAARA